MVSASPGRTRWSWLREADAELGEHFAQVVLDRARADEQPGADLRVGEPMPGQPRDLGFLGGQLNGRLDGVLARGLACRLQLAPGQLGEPSDAHRVQHLVNGARLLRASPQRRSRRSHSP
jgi:hypothetical protein